MFARSLPVCLLALFFLSFSAPAHSLNFGWQPDVRVDDDSSLNSKKASPRITCAATGVVASNYPFLAAWKDNRNGDIDPDIYYSDSTSNGSAWTANILVSDGGGCGIYCPYEYYPDIAFRAADASYWVVWQEEDQDQGDIFAKYSTDSGASWSAKMTVFQDTGTQSHPRIAQDPAYGWLYVAYADNSADDGDIYVTRYLPGVSSAWSVPVKVNDNANGTLEDNPAISVDENGNVFVIWADGRDQGSYDQMVYFSKWMGSGTWGSFEANVPLCDPTCEFTTGHDITTGVTGTDLWATRIERVGTGPAMYDFVLYAAYSANAGTSWTTSEITRLNGSALLQEYQTPSVAVDGTGAVHIVWVKQFFSSARPSRLMYTFSADSGTNWTSPEQANDVGDQFDSGGAPDLAAGPMGNVIAVWPTYRLWSSPQIFSAVKKAEYTFSAKAYIAANPDLAGSVTMATAITHYGLYGFSEERATWFNAGSYLQANPDLAAAGVTTATALNHYDLYGKAEGRLVYFNPQDYLDANPDLAAAGVTTATALTHYNLYGKAEARLTWFDPAQFLAANPDLPPAGVTEATALSFFNVYGRAEGRFIAFDGQAYLDMNPDIAAYYTAQNCVFHYYSFGRAEGRPFFGVTAP